MRWEQTQHSSVEDLRTQSHQESYLRDRCAQLLRAACRRADLHITCSADVFNLYCHRCDNVKRANCRSGWNNPFQALLKQNETTTRGTCLQQRPAPGAKMSLYYQNWRILQILFPILFATITSVLMQGKWPVSNWLQFVLKMLYCVVLRGWVKADGDNLTWSLSGLYAFILCRHCSCR